MGVKKGGRGTWALDRQCKYSGMCPQQEICSDSGFCAKLKILGEEVRNLRGGVLVGFWLGVCYCHRKPEAYHSVICSCQSSNSYLSLFEGIPFSHLIGG